MNKNTKLFIWVLVAIIIVAIGWYVFISRPMRGSAVPPPTPQNTVSSPTSTIQTTTAQGSTEASSSVNTANSSGTGSSASANNPTNGMDPFQNAYTNPF